MAEGKAGFHGKTHTWQSGFNPDGKSGLNDPPAQPPKCPECSSNRTWKDGLRYLGDGTAVQRFLCRACGYRFSDTTVKLDVFRQLTETSDAVNKLAESGIRSRNITFKEPFNESAFSSSENIAPHRESTTIPTMGKDLYRFSSHSRKCRVCDSERESKNLVAVAPPKSRLAGATKLDKATINGKIIEFAWYLHNQGRREGTIKTYSGYLWVLHRAGANLLEPESVKEVIANHFKEQNTKCLVTYVYDAFLNFSGKTWDKPKYKTEHKQVFIPTDKEIQLTINYGNRQSVVFNHFLYETGARCNEAERLEWTEIDVERCKVTLKASKNGKARTISIPRQLVNMLLTMPKTGKTVFPPRKKGSRRTAFRKRMITLARIHDNPRLLKIHFHTFRHCKALRELHKTNNMQHVKRVLGHRSILTTQRYVDLYTEIYSDLKPEDFVCEIATTVKEARKLIETGFEYVTGEYDDGGKLFRKVKS